MYFNGESPCWTARTADSMPETREGVSIVANLECLFRLNAFETS